MCNFNGTGSECKGIHPCVIISVNIRDETSKTVIVVPITHQDKKKQPTHYFLYKDKYDFFKYPKNTVLCDGVQTVDKVRLQRKMGYISWNDLYYILDRLKYNFEPYYSNYKNKNSLDFPLNQ